MKEKSDIHGFGVVLLELITEMRSMDQRREKREMALAYMFVSRIQIGLLHKVLVVDAEARKELVLWRSWLFQCGSRERMTSLMLGKWWWS